MKYIIENWYIIVGILALLIVAGIYVYKFAGLPTKSQVAKIKEWLLYAVIIAEENFGSGTGELKLRFVYDLFVSRFPLVAKVVSFDTFHFWVKEALEAMEKMLKDNKDIKELVGYKV